jgi:hypothetical protein
MLLGASRAMMKSDFFLGPDKDLSKAELEALVHVKTGVRVSEWAYRKLELADLIEEGLRGWQLTQAGGFRLASGK